MSAPSGFSFKKIVPKVCNSFVFDDLQQITSNGEFGWAASSTQEDSEYKKISSKLGATIAIKDDGTLWGWGMNAAGCDGQYGGRLGRYHVLSFGVNKQTVAVCCPTQIFSGQWKDVSLSNNIGMGIKTDGTLWTWGAGNGYDGSLGSYLLQGSSSSPVQTVIGGDDWKTVSANPYGGTAIKTDGTLWSWGCNFHGTDAVYGCVTNMFSLHHPQKQFTTVEKFANTEIITSNILGAASLTESSDPTYKDPEGWSSDPAVIASQGGKSSWWELTIPFQIEFDGIQYNKVFVNASSYITFGDWPGYTGADSEFGGVGYNYNLGTFLLSKILLGVNSNKTCKRIFYGVEGTAPNRTYRIRHENPSNLGWEITFYEEFPSRIDINKDASLNISDGWTGITNDKFYFVDYNTLVTALGSNGFRINSLSYYVDPANLAEISKWKSTASFESRINVALKTDGTLWTWGYGRRGELGNDRVVCINNSPIQTVAGGTNWKIASMSSVDYRGFNSASATIAGIKTDGSLWLWGCNSCGVLGIGSNATCISSISSPVQTVAGGTDWKSISLAPDSAKALKCDGTMWTWGTNRFYANGLCNSLLVRKNKIDGSTNSPIPVDIAADKKWKCINTNLATLVPGLFSGYANYGCPQTIALDCDGNLWGWGSNVHSSMGIGIFPSDRNNIEVDSYCRIQKPKLLGAPGVWSANVDIETTDTKIATGYESSTQHSKAAIKNDGTLWRWGLGACGNLGDGSVISKSSPVQTTAGGTNWKSVVLTRNASFALKTDGSLWGWGCRPGSDASCLSTPTQLFNTGFTWNQISAAYSLKTAIRNDNTLWLWMSEMGGSSYGSLGNNSTVLSSSPIQTISGGTNWKQACAHDQRNVSAIKTDGTLWLWGRGFSGILGNNSTVNRSSPVQTVAGGTNWKQVSGFTSRTAATKTDGTLWVWGLCVPNSDCFRGPGQYNQSSPVQTFSGGTDWKRVEFKGTLARAIKCDGSLWWWGCGGSGGGNGMPQRYAGAYQRPNLNPYVSNVVQTDYGSVLTASGNLYTFGWNVFGQAGFLCRGVKITSNNNVEYTETLIDLADEFFTKEEVSNAGLWAWGYNNDNGANEGGQLPIGGSRSSTSLPVLANRSLEWCCVTAYNSQAFALKTDGTLWGWGCNYIGRLGTGNTTNSNGIIRIGNDSNWTKVCSGWTHTGGVKSDGTLWMWGDNAQGQLGINNTTNMCVPTQAYLTSVKDLHLGIGISAATGCDGTLWTWGIDSFGGLGSCFAVYRVSSPAQVVTGGTTWKSADFTGKHVLAVKTDGTLWGWGRSERGSLLEINSDSCICVPTRIAYNSSNWKQAATYWNFMSIGIKTDGTLWTWGSNCYAGLGNGLNYAEMPHVSSPVQTVAGGTNWKCLAEPAYSKGAIKTDGTLWAWGLNTFYAPYSILGIGKTGQCYCSPIQVKITSSGIWKSASFRSLTSGFGIFESDDEL